MLEKRGDGLISSERDFVKAPRIAVVSHAHPSISKGGGEIAAYSLYLGLQKLGVHAIFIAMCPEAQRDQICLGSSHEYVILHRPELYEHFYQLATPDISAALNRILHDEQIAIVNFQHFFSIGLGALRSARSNQPLKKVVTFHEFLAICHNHGQMVTREGQVLCERATPAACTTCFPWMTRQQFAVRKSLFLSAFGEADAYVSPSRFLADRFVGWGLPADRMNVIENGLPNPPRHSTGAVESEKQNWTFGFFGQINPFKGMDLLIQAAELLRRERGWKGRISIRVHGNLIGQSEQFTTRFREAVASDPVLSWSGPYDNSSVGRLMSDCDYVLVPSRWWENSPVVIQEAYAVGRPVICTGIGGMAEKVLDGKTGFHFRVNDHFDFVNVLKKAADVDVYRKLQAGLPTPFDGKEMARRYVKLFRTFPDLAWPKPSGTEKDVVAPAQP
jgi:glycosyltransferase involved in cell wall biosynthesis